MAALLTVCCFVALVTTAIGSTVTFDKTPDVIHTILTKEMTLTCSVNDSVTSTSGSLVGKRSVEHTQTNVQFVTSMVILRDGMEVATVTPFSPATAVQDKNQLNVSGSVNGNLGEKGHLRLQWSYPDELQSGNYTCEVNGIGPSGHSVTFSTSVVMPVKTPDMPTIIRHVHDQEVRLEGQDVQIQHLLKQLELQKTQVDNQLTQMKTEMVQSENKMMGLLNESGHFENGTVVCGQASSWTGGSQRSKEMSVTFQTPYSKSPIVHLSPVHLDHYAANNRAGYTSYWIDLVNVTDTGFTVRCKSRYQASYFYLNEFTLDWISLP